MHKIVKEIIERFNNELGRCYQGSYELGIKGHRQAEPRFKNYELQNYITKDSKVLDIGCNCGFLSLLIGNYVKEVYGVDIQRRWIDIANLAKEYLKRDNCNFSTADFKFHDFKTKYNLILFLAMHEKIKPFDIVAKKIVSLMNEKGYLLIESHGLYEEGLFFEERVNLLKELGLVQIKEGYNNFTLPYPEHEDVKRKFVILQRSFK